MSISNLRNPNYQRQQQQLLYIKQQAAQAPQQSEYIQMPQKPIETTTGGGGGLSAPMEEIKIKTKKQTFKASDIADTPAEIVQQIITLKPGVNLVRKALSKYADILQEDEILF